MLQEAVWNLRGTAKRPVGLQHGEQRRRLGPAHTESLRLFVFAGAIKSPQRKGTRYTGGTLRGLAHGLGDGW